MTRPYDAVIIGSGMGGAMAAHGLVHAGMRVLMLERGPHVERGEHNWAPDAALELSPYYTHEGHYVVRGDDEGRAGTFQCVGGPSVFYGGVALRLRERDFAPVPEIEGSSGAAWPIGYADLRGHYGEAERILRVAGRPGENPTDPPGTEVYPRRAPDARGPAALMWGTARSLDLEPCHLPLAIDFGEDAHAGGACIRCGTCDGYACGVSAKQEPSTAVLPELVARGLTLVPNTVVVRLLWRGARVEGVVGVERTTGRRRVFRAERYLLAAGALGSAHLVLASGLEAASPARPWVGRGLMRHCNGIVYGLWRRPLEGSRAFHKQVGIFDHYGAEAGQPKLGCIQSIHPPPVGLIRDRAPGFLKAVAEPLADRCTGLLVIAEDEPRPENGIEVSRTKSDRHGLARAVVTHRYTRRDVEARRRLASIAREVVRAAGAKVTHMFPIRTFSHAVGTLRMGPDPATSPLDGQSRFRGIANLWVTDGSFMPRSGGVNPSLTIAANALRTADLIVGVEDRGRAQRPIAETVAR